jgi:hypothetical protein
MTYKTALHSTAIGLLLTTSAAFADQCAYNDYKTAAAAREVIKRLADINSQKPSIYTYCEPCGAKFISRVYLSPNHDAQGAHQNPYDVRVEAVQNGDILEDKPLGIRTPNSRAGFWRLRAYLDQGLAKYADFDLAYTYVKVGAGRYLNVANIVGCPADDVSLFVETDGVNSVRVRDRGHD